MEQRVLRLAERAERADAHFERVTRRMARGTMRGENTAEELAATAAPAVPHVATRYTATQPLDCFIGDDTDTPTLKAALERILRVRPTTLQELVTMTGARANRISGALVKMQLGGVPMVNLGTRRLARYFVLPERP